MSDRYDASSTPEGQFQPGSDGRVLANWMGMLGQIFTKAQNKIQHPAKRYRRLFPRRLCLMNMFLHNIGEIDGDAPISPNDALVADAGQRFDYVLANPPFGKKSSMSFTNKEGEQEKDELTYNRQDFWATTSNKQLNFVQHIRTMLKTTGRAAVVVPDNVLFEGGAGEIIRRKLLENTDLDNLPEPDELAEEIIENLEAGLNSFREV